jgi:hypothetical protein
MAGTKRRRVRRKKTDTEAERTNAELDQQAKDAADRDRAHETITSKQVECDDSVPAGTLIRVTYGTEKFSPIQFHVFEVGGCFIDVRVTEHETALDAWRRGYAILKQMVAEEFKGKLSAYAKRVTAADNYVRAHAAKS